LLTTPLRVVRRTGLATSAAAARRTLSLSVVTLLLHLVSCFVQT
jgi:hypothetical protein